MERIMIFDTSILSENLGDTIIMDSCMEHIKSIFPCAFKIHVPTHEVIGRQTYDFAEKADHIIMAGTNILKADMKKNFQWKIRKGDAKRIHDICLMGVGWWQYQDIRTDKYTRNLLNQLLSHKNLHSVRDEYTKRRLQDIGFDNVICTACPTMWKLSKELCSQIPREKCSNVIFTLTDYMRNPKQDKKLIDILLKNYDRCFMWLQAYDDYRYIHELVTCDRISFISPSLEEYDSFLANNEVDYVGTRLHAGIRALNNKKRTIIIGIDNRAIEISKDTNLPIIERNNIDYDLERKIIQGFKTEIVLPENNINTWKKQFINAN